MKLIDTRDTIDSQLPCLKGHGPIEGSHDDMIAYTEFGYHV